MKFTPLYLLLLALLFSTDIQASSPRIIDLMPNDVAVHLGIEPAIPTDFVAVKRKQCSYWGREKDLKSFLSQPQIFKGSVIKVSWDFMPQKLLQLEASEILKLFEGIGWRNCAVYKTSWGKYPVLVVHGTPEDEPTVFRAYVDALCPDYEGMVTFDLVYSPYRRKALSDNELDIWENFLANTKVLDTPEYIKALGYDMRDGFTLANKWGAKWEIYAQELEDGSKIQVVVIPKTAKVSVNKIDFSLMDGEWKNDSLIAIVEAQVEYEYQENAKLMIPAASCVFVKQVEAFSFDMEKLQETPEITAKVFEFERPLKEQLLEVAAALEPKTTHDLN